MSLLSRLYAAFSYKRKNVKYLILVAYGFQNMFISQVNVSDFNASVYLLCETKHHQS